jgi:hypothetical protein
MVLAALLRHAWRAVLACTPRPVLLRLDAWSQGRAQRRAESRRRRLLLRQARRT